MSVRVDRVSAGIAWTVETLAPHSQGLLHHLGSDIQPDNKRTTVKDINVEHVETTLC